MDHFPIFKAGESHHATPPHIHWPAHLAEASENFMSSKSKSSPMSSKWSRAPGCKSPTKPWSYCGMFNIWAYRGMGLSIHPSLVMRYSNMASWQIPQRNEHLNANIISKIYMADVPLAISLLYPVIPLGASLFCPRCPCKPRNSRPRKGAKSGRPCSKRRTSSEKWLSTWRLAVEPWRGGWYPQEMQGGPIGNKQNLVKNRMLYIWIYGSIFKLF